MFFSRRTLIGLCDGGGTGVVRFRAGGTQRIRWGYKVTKLNEASTNYLEFLPNLRIFQLFFVCTYVASLF